MKKKTAAILGLAGAATVATAIKAARFVPEKKDYGTPEKENVDAERCQEHLSKALAIPTISYPDKSKIDFTQFDKFHAFLEEAFPLIHKNLKKEVIQEASLIYHWKGTRDDLEPIALLAHQDVVPISEGTEQDWEHEPFSGDIADGFVWGRGAVDMKNHVVAVLESVETLLEDGFEPERTVYLCFGHNEEVVASPNNGAKKISALLESRGVRLDSVLDEGGAILPINVPGVINKNLAGIGIAEKGYCDYRISLTAKGGHSSTPPKHTALGKMADVIKDIENNQFKSEITPVVDGILDKVGRNTSFLARNVVCNAKFLKPVLKVVMSNIPAAASWQEVAHMQRQSFWLHRT